MMKMMIATAIAAVSLLSPGLSAYEKTDDNSVSEAMTKTALMDAGQSTEQISGLEQLAAVEGQVNLDTLQTGSESLCNAKTFCVLD
jgi:hypothetical protein